MAGKSWSAGRLHGSWDSGVAAETAKRIRDALSEGPILRGPGGSPSAAGPSVPSAPSAPSVPSASSGPSGSSAWPGVAGTLPSEPLARTPEPVGRERREFTRVPFDMDVDVEMDSRLRLSGRSRDVSLKGLFLQCEPRPAVGTTCAATLHFAGRGSELCIETIGRVVRADGDGIGIEFSAVGSGGLDHLKNMILYNSENPDDVLREFRSHLGIRPREWPFCD